MSPEVGGSGTSWVQDWGPHRGHIVDAAARCADYYGRVRRSLSGEIPSDPHYVAEKAQALAEAAEELSTRCREVERWLRNR